MNKIPKGIFLLFLLLSIYQSKAQDNPCDSSVPLLEFDIDIVSPNLPGDPNIYAGDKFCINFRVNNFVDISTVNFVINFDPNVVEFDPDVPINPAPGSNLGGEIAINDLRVDEGIMNISWIDAFGLTATLQDGDIFMTVCFEAATDAGGECSQLITIDGDIYNPSFPVLVQVGTDVTTACQMDSIIFNNANVEPCIECADPTVTDLQVCQSSGNVSFGACGPVFPIAVEFITSAPQPFRDTLIDENSRVNYLSLPDGTYAIELTDDDGVKSNIEFFIIDRSTPGIALDTTITNPRCFNTTNGKIDYSFTGGIPDYSIQLSNGVYYDDDSGTMENLGNGDYSITVTDDLGCSAVFEDIELFTPPLEVVVDIDSFLCLYDDGGVIKLTPSGGVPFPGVEYEFKNMLDDCFVVTDPMGETLNNTSGFNEVDTCYRASIKDSRGCIIEECIKIPLINRLPLEFDTIPPECDGLGYSASILLDPNFPVQGIFTNRLLKAGQFDPIATGNGNGCGFVGFGIGCGIPLPGGTNNFLDSGNYTWTVALLDPTDLNRTLCEESISFSIPDFSTDPLFVTPVAVQPDCGQDNGLITVMTTGGNGDYSYRWEFDTLLNQRIVTDLPAGLYNVTVSDSKGCKKDTFVDLQQGVFLTVDGLINRELDCQDPTLPAQLEADFSGFDLADLTFNWFTENESDLGTNPTLETDTAGVYIVEVSNTTGTCVVLDTIEITDPGRLTYEINPIDPAMCGVAIPTPGSIDIFNIQGGTGNYNCSWEKDGIPLPPPSVDCFRDNLAAGTYMITISDATGMGCPTEIEVVLQSNDEVNFVVNPTLPTCPGWMDGVIAIEGPIGGAALICTWDDPAITSTTCVATNLVAGEYLVRIEDVNGCRKDSIVTLEDKEIFTATVTDTVGISCAGLMDGTATATIDVNPEGFSTFGYVWSNGDADTGGLSGTNSALVPGDNIVIISDENSCTVELDFFITDVPEIALVAGTNAAVTNCSGECNATINLQATGGTAPNSNYTFLWEVDNMSTASRNLCAGKYAVMITDERGCEKVDTVTVMDADSIKLEILSQSNIGCQDPGAGGSLTIGATGGCGMFSYDWTDAASDSDNANALEAKEYIITVTDDCGCSDTISATIDGSSEIFAEAIISGPPSCEGETVCLGIDTTTISGGTGLNYTFTIGSGALGGRIPIDSCVQLLPGPHSVSVFDSDGCQTDLGLFMIPSPEIFTVDLGPDIQAEIGEDAVEITAEIVTSYAIVDIDWAPEDGWECVDSMPCDVINYTANSNSLISVIVTNENGCTARDEVEINLDTPRRVYRPTAFLPDSDIDNKFMLETGRGVERIEDFIIYDKWGNKVFELPDAVKDFPHSKDDGWDGRKNNQNCESGVYVWIANVVFSDNVTIPYKGQITLIR